MDETLPTAFETSRDWFATWDAAYLGDAKALEIEGLTLLDEQARLGPLRYCQRRSRTNVHTPAYDWHGAADPSPALPKRLLAGGADVVTIDYLPAGSRLLAAAKTWGAWRCHVAPHALSPTVDCRASYAEWLGRRSKRVRYRWPRLEAHVTGALGMRYECHERFDDLPGLLNQLFAVERAGWKGRAGTAIADSPADTLFYTALATRAAAAGALRIVLLRQGDRITAFEYGIIGGDRVYLLKVGYDETFEDASIGHVLAAMHIRDCCEDPRFAWYDKLGNGMTPAAYKLRFADVLDPLYRLTLYAPTWRGWLLRLHDSARRYAKAWRDWWRARKAQTKAMA